MIIHVDTGSRERGIGTPLAWAQIPCKRNRKTKFGGAREQICVPKAVASTTCILTAANFLYNFTLFKSTYAINIAISCLRYQLQSKFLLLYYL